MGLEFRESSLSISNKNTKTIEEGMVFNISPGFHNLESNDEEDPKRKIYSMMIADTVVVSKAGTDPKVLTTSAPSSWDEISYSTDQEDEEEEKPKSKSKPKGKERSDYDFGPRTTRARDAGKEKKDTAAEERRKKHQEELERKKQEEAAARFSKGKISSDAKEAATVKDVVAYKSAVEFPPEARNGRIFIDQKREAVLLPIYGMLVPFHISTIKNATKSEDCLRINFITPGSTLPNDKLPKVFRRPLRFQLVQTNFILTLNNDLLKVWKDGKATFIREMGFRCSDQKSLATSLRLINELRKRASSRAHDTHVRDSLVAQEELILSKGALSVHQVIVTL